jgi:hypothetical protein
VDLTNFLHLLVHKNTPHSAGSIYVSAAIVSLVAVVAVYLRCKQTNSAKQLENRWIGRTASFAAPLPVYVMMMLVPLDPDLVKAMMQDFLIVALAGLYGVSEVINDVRGVAGRAREKAGL